MKRLIVLLALFSAFSFPNSASADGVVTIDRTDASFPYFFNILQNYLAVESAIKPADPDKDDVEIDIYPDGSAEIFFGHRITLQLDPQGYFVLE